EPVEVSESDDLAGLLLALNIAYKFCPELVLKTKLENKYLIFDHQAKPVLRDSEIIEGLSLKADNKKKKVKTLKIDIEKIWNVIKEKDEVKRIKKCLKEVEKKLKPAEKVILIGRKQALVFLLVQYCLYGLAEEIWYKKSEKSKNIKIK
ncbi:MAG: hypothetical protein HQ538_04445, partial [Parcubacteria group bacterium]|nr:hypothetical protein [Parcubacteria group bacterium]